MKILCVQEPWASAIIEGFSCLNYWFAKDVENRSWRPKVAPGRIAIMATRPRSRAQWDLDSDAVWDAAREHLAADYGGQPSVFMQVPLACQDYADAVGLAGEIIGSVNVFDVRLISDSPWAGDSHWHWLLREPLMYGGPIGAKGRLGLWELPEPAATELEIDEAQAVSNVESWPELRGLTPMLLKEEGR